MNTPDENEWSAEEQRLRSALNAAAEQVTPGPDGLARIRRRTTAATPWWRRPVVLGLAGATAVAAAFIAGGVVVLGDDGADTAVTADSPSPPPTDGATSTPSESGVAEPDRTTTAGGEPRSEAPVRSLTVPVYYGTAAEAPESFDILRLAREFHTIDTADPPVLAALREMADAEALDPDYRDFAFWAGDISSVDVSPDEITVDVAALPEIEAVGSDPSRHELAVQELVYTATAAAAMHDLGGSQPVRITVGGEPAGEYGGLDLSQPVERADPLEIRQLVQIDDPAEGASVESPVVVSGSGAAFEATLAWEVRESGGAGEVVASDHTTADECCTMSPFEFEAELEPGTYEVVVSEVDVSGGEGRPPMSDSKTFTVE